MRGLLIDLDGVVWQNDNVVPGAPETLAWCKEQGIPHLFITNTTSQPRRLIAAKLARLGMEVSADAILTPPVAACNWLAKNNPGPAVLFVPAATKEDFTTVKEYDAAMDNAASVIIGDIGDEWTYHKLNQAFRLLMGEPPPVLIALGMTRYWRAAEGLRLDVAPFVTALEHAAGCKSVVLGKPSAAFFGVALTTIGCKPDETVMIGDDIVGDIDGAQQVGMFGILVRTGKFRKQDLEGAIIPGAVLDSIAALPSWWSKTINEVHNHETT
jgi:phospholysine phosphohistidine inorganic pyrophosphate phosphatase